MAQTTHYPRYQVILRIVPIMGASLAQQIQLHKSSMGQPHKMHPLIPIQSMVRLKPKMIPHQVPSLHSHLLHLHRSTQLLTKITPQILEISRIQQARLLQMTLLD